MTTLKETNQAIEDATKETVANFLDHVERNMATTLEYDGVCTLQKGGLQMWFEKDNSAMVINAPSDGWGEIPAIENIQQVMEYKVETTTARVVENLGWTMEKYNAMDLKPTIKQMFTNKFKIPNPPIYLIVSKTFTDYSKEEQKFLMGYMVSMSIHIMAVLLGKVDLAPKPTNTRAC